MSCTVEITSLDTHLRSFQRYVTTVFVWSYDNLLYVFPDCEYTLLSSVIVSLESCWFIFVLCNDIALVTGHVVMDIKSSKEHADPTLWLQLKYNIKLNHYISKCLICVQYIYIYSINVYSIASYRVQWVKQTIICSHTAQKYSQKTEYISQFASKTTQVMGVLVTW